MLPQLRNPQTLNPETLNPTPQSPSLHLERSLLAPLDKPDVLFRVAGSGGSGLGIQDVVVFRGSGLAVTNVIE